MQEKINRLREIFEGYGEVVKKLYKMAEEQNDRAAMKQLRTVWDRLQQGPVRAMVIGVSSAGKSTLLNALAGSIVVPEGPHTTSPVPVWIYSSGAVRHSPDVRIFKTEGGSLPSAKNNRIGRYAFMTDYCYTPSQAARGSAKGKFADVTAATVNVNVETKRIYDSGITFMDTPGIGVAIDDNTRVDDTISGGCEFALVVFREMTNETHEFLRSQFVNKNAPLNGILQKGRVFAVHNCFGAGTEQDARAHIKNTFNGQLDDRLFMINARYARKDSAGYYDYVGLLPADSRDRVADEAAKIMDEEHEALAEAEDTARTDLQQQRQESRAELDKLWAALESGVRELLDKPEEVLMPVCSSINGCFKKLKLRDTELKNELNKLNKQSFELIKKARSRDGELRKADYDARVKAVQKILGMGADSVFIKNISIIEQDLIKESHEAFIKNAEFRNHRPLADEYNESRQVAMEHIMTEQGCHDLLNKVIDPRLRRMNDMLRLNLSRRYFGSPEIRGMTAKFMDEFAAAGELAESLEKPISAQEPWCSGDVDEKIARTIADMAIKGVQAGSKAPNLTVRPNMGWYERSLIEACTAAHEKAMKAVAFMNPLTVNSDMSARLSAFLKEKQQRAAAGGIRGSWTRNGVNVDLEYKFFAQHISAGIKAFLTQYCSICKETLIKEVQEKVTGRLLKKLSENYKESNLRNEREINSIREQMGL